MAVTVEGYGARTLTTPTPRPTLILVNPSLKVIATPTLVILKPIASPSPSPTVTATADPSRTPPTLAVDPNPAGFGSQITLSGTGVAGHGVVLFVQGMNRNVKFTLNSDGRFSGAVNVSEGIGITGPGSYDLYLMDTRTEVKSSSVTLNVVSPGVATPQPSETPTPTVLATFIPGNYSNVNAASATPTAIPSPTPEATPADNNTTAVHYMQTTNKTIPALPMDATAAAILVTAGALLAMERARNK